MERGKNCSRTCFFPILDSLNGSGDIRDKIRKLSKVESNFRRFFALPNFSGAGLQKIVPTLWPLPRTSYGKCFVRILPLAPMLANKTLLFVGQSSRDFFRGTREELLSITFLSDFGYLQWFRRYSRSKSKVVKNRVEFWTFFSPSQILGAGLPKVIPTLTPASRHVVWKTFCGDTHTSPEVLGSVLSRVKLVLGAHTLNFRPNSKFSRLNFFFWGGGPRPSSGVR